MFKKVKKCLKKKYQKEFDIQEVKGIEFGKTPEISMRLYSEIATKLGSRNVYKFIKQK